MFKDVTNMDELKILPSKGVDTLYKAVYRLHEKMPNHEMLGTRVGQKYEW